MIVTNTKAIARCSSCRQRTYDKSTRDGARCERIMPAGSVCGGVWVCYRAGSADESLAAVRELAENAMLRPAPTRLRLCPPAAVMILRRNVISWEDLHPPIIKGGQSAHGRRPDSRKPRELAPDEERCADCGKRPRYCFCNRTTASWAVLS